jgi:hypothetical protein
VRLVGEVAVQLALEPFIPEKKSKIQPETGDTLIKPIMKPNIAGGQLGVIFEDLRDCASMSQLTVCRPITKFSARNSCRSRIAMRD